MKTRAKRSSTLQWIADPLAEEPSFLQKKMFGCEAIYLRGKMVLGLAEGAEPWDGVLLPTDRQHHASLQQEYPALTPHAILGKWLYLSRRTDCFEQDAARLVEHIQSGDPRIGVEPKPRRRSARVKA